MSRSREVVVLCPARDASPYLVNTLPLWLHYADHVILADQGSGDETRALAARFGARVSVIDNPADDFDESVRARLLLTAARQRGPERVLLYLDWDESLSANVLHAPEWRRFLGAPPGTAGYMRWVHLVGGPDRYAARGILTPSLGGPFAFVDDGREAVGLKAIHGSRGPGSDGVRFDFEQVVVLHYSRLGGTLSALKGAWYKVYFRRRGGRAFWTCRNHNGERVMTAADLEPLPRDWVAEFEAAGWRWHWQEPELPWQALDVLRSFAVYGEQRFWALDIWDEFDWEDYRRRAERAGHSDIPRTPINGPPSHYRAYHRLMRPERPPGSWIRGALRTLLNRILP